MKKIVSFLTATALVATMMTTSSCSKTCDAGYEGSDCKTLKAQKFVGTWSGSDHCSVGNSTYNIVFVSSTTASSIQNVSISNFAGFGSTVYVTGTVDSTNSGIVRLTNQDLGGDRHVNGTITISGSSLVTAYTVDSAGVAPDVCAGTFTKR